MQIFFHMTNGIHRLHEYNYKCLMSYLTGQTEVKWIFLEIKTTIRTARFGPIQISLLQSHF